MKYIKLYDSHISNTYEEVSEISFEDVIYGEGRVLSHEDVTTGWCSFTSDEVIKMDNTIGSDYRIFELKDAGLETDKILFLRKKTPVINTKTSIHFPSDEEWYWRGVGEIFKLKDEWYYVTISKYGENDISKYYKCDQMEGLLACLKDKFTK